MSRFLIAPCLISFIFCVSPTSHAAELQPLPEITTPDISVTLDRAVVQADGEPVHGAQMTAFAGGQSFSSETGFALVLHSQDTLHYTVTSHLPAAGATDMAGCMDESAFSVDGTAPDGQKGWLSADGLVNTHFHGFLTPPTRGTAGAGYGDYIFDCASPAPGSGSTPQRVGQTESYTIPLSSWDNGRIGSGMNGWFHPHVHQIAKAQVSLGLTGMVILEPDCASPNGAADWSCHNTRPVRNILLRDMQLVHLGDPGETYVWAEEEADFCGGNEYALSNEGYCAGNPANIAGYDNMPTDPAPFSTGDPLQDHRWLFTLNGQRYPDITVGQQGEVFRVQNASANITYRLSLRPRLTNNGQVASGPLPMQVLSMDGAGLVTGGTAQTTDRITTRELFLMPGARAVVLVSHDAQEEGCPGTCPASEWQLVTEAFQAGITPAAADLWPRIALAAVHLQAGVSNQSIEVAARVDPAAVARELVRQAPLAEKVSIQNAIAQERAIQILAPAASQPSQAPSPDMTQPLVTTILRNSVQGRVLSDLLRQKAPLMRGPTPPAASPQLRLPMHGGAQTGHPPSDPAKQLVVANCQSTHPDLLEDNLRRLANDTSVGSLLRRRVYFAIDPTPGQERFLLGQTLLSRASTTVDWTETTLDGTPLETTLPNGTKRRAIPLAAMDMDVSHAQFCAFRTAYASSETWELVNVSREVHNFHIHQSVFTVHRRDDGSLEVVTRHPDDAQVLPNALPVSGGSGGSVYVEHDTIIVPRAAPAYKVESGDEIQTGCLPQPVGARPTDRFTLLSDSCPQNSWGSIAIDIGFGGSQFAATAANRGVSKFVFHCHILEHEDKGMMASFAVIDSAVDLVSDNH